MTKRRSGTSKNGPQQKAKKGSDSPACGLCGKKGNLTKTECCGRWICDDADNYVLFSYSRNSCYRNHDRYTLCGYHHAEGHSGDWKTCAQCRDSIETEMYVHYGTNKYNFEVLEDPPSYEPTRCSKCNRIIKLAKGGYSVLGDEYTCSGCGRFGS